MRVGPAGPRPLVHSGSSWTSTACNAELELESVMCNLWLYERLPMALYLLWFFDTPLSKAVTVAIILVRKQFAFTAEQTCEQTFLLDECCL